VIVVDTMSLARDERTDLAAFLESLPADQWTAPTLCEDWRIRDVIAHVYSYEDLGFGGWVGRMVQGRMNPDRANEVGVGDFADASDADLVARARACIQPRGLTAMMGGKIALTDGMIHHQDIRRPLGLVREIPPERLRAALDTAKTAPTLRSAKRIRGVTLTATDLDWTTGTGPLVEGPGEALLMVIAGRRGIAAELTGPGVATLVERIGG
jgi:uncharacterized protein (TIGR03083 family)